MDIEEITPSKGDAVLNINRSRLRSVYYRPIETNGTVTWRATLPLPADPQSIAQYFAKGFKAKPPAEGTEIKEKSAGVILCPFCDYEPASPLALRSHLRKHITQTTEEKEE